jgi:hypothetical protein
MGYPLPDGTTRIERDAVVAVASAAPAATPVRSRAPEQGPSDDRQRHPVAAGHGGAVARLAGAVRLLAHGVFALPPLAAGRGLGAGAGGVAGRGRCPRRAGLESALPGCTTVRAHQHAAGAKKGAVTTPSAAPGVASRRRSTCAPNGEVRR